MAKWNTQVPSNVSVWQRHAMRNQKQRKSQCVCVCVRDMRVFLFAFFPLRFYYERFPGRVLKFGHIAAYKS